MRNVGWVGSSQVTWYRAEVTRVAEATLDIEQRLS
jgi:hypothetical protein